jgi:tripartite-type tricarboxylate transporter receptor subunit TctC
MPQRQDLPYKTTGDFTPIANAVEQAFVLAVRTEAPWRTLRELLQAAQQRPGELRVGNSGLGTIAHLNAEMLKEKAGVQWTTVPFPQGDAEGVTAILGGHVDVYVANFSMAVPHARAGKLRLLTYFADARNPVASDVPTPREQGYDAALTSYILIYGPKGIPESVVSTLSDAFQKGIEADAFKKFAQDQGLVARYQSPAELRARNEKDYILYGEMIKKLGLKAGN